MQSPQPRAWVEIDLGALIQNAEILRERAGVPLLPVVKADAYGLGASRVAQELQLSAPWGFAVATLDEGLALREAGISLPVLLLTPALPEELDDIHAYRLTPALADRQVIEMWCGRPNAPWHLAVETGMHRSGVRWSNVHRLAELLGRTPPQGAFTHFHSPEKDDGSVEIQEARFREAIGSMPARPALLHAESSAAIVRRSRSEWDLVRPGIFLYGVGSGAGAAVQPAEVVSLKARVVEIHNIEDGDTVSYGATYVARGARRIATTALGYADGYRRAFGNAGWASINGGRAPVAGIVTMDMTMLDVTGIQCRVGDVATFLGKTPERSEPLEVSAESVGLSPYELMATLRTRLPRIYVQS
jgi:alanine racemase